MVAFFRLDADDLSPGLALFFGQVFPLLDLEIVQVTLSPIESRLGGHVTVDDLLLDIRKALLEEVTDLLLHPEILGFSGPWGQ